MPDQPVTTTLPIGRRVLLPNFQGRTFVYATVLAVEGPNVKVRLERPSYTEREPFWTSRDRLVTAANQG